MLEEIIWGRGWGGVRNSFKMTFVGTNEVSSSLVAFLHFWRNLRVSFASRPATVILVVLSLAVMDRNGKLWESPILPKPDARACRELTPKFRLTWTG